MIRQEIRRLTRKYQKELDNLVKASDEVYHKNKDAHLKIQENIESLKKNTCEDKKLQAYYNLMKNVTDRVALLQREITRINNK